MERIRTKMNSFFSQSRIHVVFILLLVSSSFLLTGCWDRKEVNDTAFVLAAALDKEKGNKIKLTVQVLVPQALNGGQQGSSGAGRSRVITRSAVGENMADAMSKVQQKFSRKIFWGHCKVYIIGERLAKAGGLRQQIDFLLRHPEPRKRAKMFVSEGYAADILEFKPIIELYIGEKLRKISELRVGVDVDVQKFNKMMMGDAEAPILPILQTVTTKHGNKKEINLYITGTAIFKKDKMIGRIDDKVTRGILWLRNETEVTAITVIPKKGESISMDPIRQTTEILPSIKNGKWKVIAKITSEGTIVQNGSTINITDPTITKQIEKKLQQDISQRIQQVLEQVQVGMKADVFLFADAFHRKYPKEWNKVKDHWDEILPQVNVELDIQTRIRRTGLSSTPAGVKETEVRTK